MAKRTDWERDTYREDAETMRIDAGDVGNVEDVLSTDPPPQTPPESSNAPLRVTYIVGVDYDEGHPETYRGVVVTKVTTDGQQERVMTFKGSFYNQDYVEATNWCQHFENVFTSSSVHNYNNDVKRLSGR